MGITGMAVLLVMVLVWSNMVMGIVIGIVVIVVLLSLFPFVKGLN